MAGLQPQGSLPPGDKGCDTAPHMDLPLTASVLAATLALAVFAGWRGARPPNPHKGPRLMPWRFIMLMAAALALMLLVHLVNLMGVTTGRP
jgi:hypothetical protein